MKSHKQISVAFQLLRLATWGCAWFFVATFCSLTHAQGPPEDRSFDRDMLDRIPARMQEFVDQGKVAGVVTLVANQNRVVHLAAVGKADLEANRKMQEDSIFRIASMTKPITATALMQLVDQGKLAIDDPVAKYLPAFKDQKLETGDAARPVTIRDILTHTAGLASPDKNLSGGASLAEVVDSIGRQPLKFAPGSKWQYSSGITVAGRLVEVASGEAYDEYLAKHIFEPLGMKDTAFQVSNENASRVAINYKPGKSPGTLERPDGAIDLTAKRTPNPSGGLYSTATDMARFYQAILGGGQLTSLRQEWRILPEPRVAEMLRPSTHGLVTGFTPGNAWGLGWCIVEKPQGVTRLLFPGTYGHGGAWGTQGWVDPVRGLIFVLMIQRTGLGNSDGSDIRDAFTELAVQAHRGRDRKNAKFAPSHGYDQTVQLTHGRARAVLCPEAGGRVLEYWMMGAQALYFDEKERHREPGKPGPASAGRFDFGPELTTPPHPTIWSGRWTAEITGERSARLISQRDEASGVQLIRDFELTAASDGNVATGSIRAMEAPSPQLVCRQTIINTSSEPKEYCHWGRSFSPSGGICLVPLAGTSRFPSKYAMYEDSAMINVRNTDDRIRERDGFLEILGPPRKPKLGFDSQAGWLAYVMPDDRMFVKRFDVYPDRVYNEAAGLTLSVWYPEGPRIELEPIGPRERLAPGEAASFTETWHLLQHPFPKDGEKIDLKKLRSQVESLNK